LMSKRINVDASPDMLSPTLFFLEVFLIGKWK